MAPAALSRAVAQAKVSHTTAAHVNSRNVIVKAMPKQAAGVAAAIFTNTVAGGMAFADEGVTLPLDIPSSSGIVDLISDNPILVGGGAFLLALPFGINALLNAGAGAGVKPTSVARTLEALEEDPRVTLVDIRSKAEIKAQGSPDLRAVKRSAVSLPFTSLVKGELVEDAAFADKFSKLRGISEDSLVILLDSDGTTAKAAARQIEGIEKIYFVQGGAEAWEETGPWRQASAGLSLSLPNLKAVGNNINELAEDFKKAPSLTKAGLAAGAIVGAGFLLFNEIEIVLEIAGLFAAGNFALKLLFADEREKTLTEIKTLVDEKVAIQEVGSDLNKIAKAVLEESPDSTTAAPAPASEEPAPAPESQPVTVAAATTDAATDNAKEAAEWIETWKSKSA